MGDVQTNTCMRNDIVVWIAYIAETDMFYYTLGNLKIMSVSFYIPQK